MATIRARKQADGSTRYTATIRIRSGEAIVNQEYKTFALRTVVLSWAKHREVALEEPGALVRVRHGAPTLGGLIRWYIQGLPVRPEIVQEARNACAELRLIGKPRKRTRRPTLTELTQLRGYFARRDKRARIPMQSVMEFALNSARRESEICRLEWRDNDEFSRSGMVRDAKHPTKKEGNHRRFNYTPEAWVIVQAQPRGSDYIFSYEPNSVSAAFTRNSINASSLGAGRGR